MVTLPHRQLIVGVFIAIVLTYTVLAIWFPLGFIWATYEDLYGEWSQTYLFLIAGILFARIVLLNTHHRWFALGLACACLYVFFEEISWGQRIFGFRSPEFFSQYNLQGETNVHNFLTGPYSTLLKSSIRYVVAIGLLAYGLVFPLLLSARQAVALRADRLGFLAPPLCLSPFFVLAAGLELQPFAFNEAEIAELLIGVALVSTAIHYIVVTRAKPETTNAAALDRQQSKRYAWQLALTLALVGALAISTTFAFNASDAHRARIERRIDNGIEKFATRYRRFEQWDTAISLYKHLLAKRPQNSFLLRSIARVHRAQGNETEFQRYAEQAVEVELAKYASEPWRASVLRSLVRGYRLLDEQELADDYLAEALAIGLSRINDHPKSANAAYSLGRTYSLAGEDAKALEQYARARDLVPTSARFRQAYLSARESD